MTIEWGCVAAHEYYGSPPHDGLMASAYRIFIQISLQNGARIVWLIQWLGYQLKVKEMWFNFQWEEDISLISKTTGQAPWSTQLVQGVSSPEVKQMEHEANHSTPSPHSVPGLSRSREIPPILICLCGMHSIILLLLHILEGCQLGDQVVRDSLWME